MAFCRSCGAAVDPARDFCTHCGARVGTTRPAAVNPDPARPVEADATLTSEPLPPPPPPPRIVEEALLDRGVDPAVPNGQARRPGPRVVGVIAVILVLGIGGGLLAARYFDRQDANAQDAAAQGDGGAGASATTLSTADQGGQSTASSEPPPTSSAAHEQAADLNALLGQSGTARGSVIDAVAAVSSCSDVSAGVDSLVAAARSRQDTLDQLDSLQGDALPNGAELLSTLRTALEKSLEADQHFVAWARSVQVRGCRGSAPQDSQYRAATQASREATAAKHRFVALWNPIATSEGLDTLEEKDI